MVLASGPELIEDVRKAPEDVLSSHVPRVEARLLPRIFDLYIHIKSSSSFSPNIQWAR